MLVLALALMALPAISANVSVAPATEKASLEVRVAGVTRPVDVVLRRQDDDRKSSVATQHLQAGTGSVAFRDLEAGTYVVIAAGADPLARRAARVRLQSGDRQRVSMRIEPRRVEGTVVRDGRPLPNVSLQLRNDELGWDAALRADAEGRFTSELWQPGSYAIGVWRGALHNTYGIHTNIAGGPLTIAVPALQIRGRVIDVASGRGVPDAQVILRTWLAESVSTIAQHTDGNGAFLFDAIHAGRHRVSVAADDYLLPDPAEITLGEDDPPAEITLRLDSGAARPLRVFDHHGEPVRGAEILAAEGNHIRSTSHTAADGRAVVAVPAEPVLLYVLARDDAFAVVGERAAERVDLPAPRSSLRIITRSILGTALPPMSFIMSVDGRIIPPAVAQRMSRLQGLSLSTDGAGEIKLQKIPPGTYQFWPFDNEAQAEAIMAAPYEAPIAVSVKAGENVIAVDFRPTSPFGAAPRH